MNPCLLFDNDGTLVDSEFLNCEAMSAQLAEAGIVETAKTLVARYRGWNLNLVLSDLQQRHSVSLPENFVVSFRARASVHFDKYLKPIAGVDQALSSLSHAKCVASNAPLSKIRHALKLTGLDRYFVDQLYSAYEIQSFKPDPHLFLHAAKKMGFEPEQCIVIEDSEVGVQAAIHAKMQVVLYDPGGIVQAPATATISAMHQLPQAIEDLCA